MLEQYGIERTDYRNLLVVVGIMALVTALLSEGPFTVRIVVGLIIGTISAITFLVVTIAINIFLPGYG